jgi:hypothetical protein
MARVVTDVDAGSSMSLLIATVSMPNLDNLK